MIRISSDILYVGEHIIDVASNAQYNFILYQENVVRITELSTLREYTIHLVQKDAIPSLIYADGVWLYCGYNNGTTEIWNIKTREFVHLTAKEDAGGPGNKIVEQIYSTGDYLFVNTQENGVLIYLKPDFEFYKWIMIGGYTTITQMSYAEERLFVLTDENQIHILDFSQSKLIPLEINIDKIMDLAYNGKFLFLATDKTCRIYNTRKNYQLIAGFNLNSPLDLSIFLDRYLVLFTLDEKMIVLDASLDFSVVKTEKLVDKIPINIIKYSYYNTTKKAESPLRVLSLNNGEVIETRIMI